MWIQILILIIVLCSLYVKEGFNAGEYSADMFASNECPCPCLNCVDKTKF